MYIRINVFKNKNKSLYDNDRMFEEYYNDKNLKTEYLIFYRDLLLVED